MGFAEKTHGRHYMAINYKDLLERVISTFVQATAGMIGVDQIVDMGVSEWKLIVGAGGAAVLSMLKGYFAARFTGNDTCSLVRDKTTSLSATMQSAKK
jgi:hypothetical protein